MKTASTNENDEKGQLTTVIQDLKELSENRMELERLRRDQLSYWRCSACVAGTPGEAVFAEPVQLAQFLDRQFADMSAGGWRVPLPAPLPAPYPVCSFPVGSDQPSGQTPKRQRNGTCYHCHQSGHFKAECPERQQRAQGASSPRSGTRTYLCVSVGAAMAYAC